MNRTRELPIIRTVVLAIGLSLAAPLQAGLFHGFNFTLENMIEDATSNASGVTGARYERHAGQWMGHAMRCSRI